MTKKPLILISNDDGITAKGIRSLVEVAKNFGEVIIVAPDGPQSAQSHSITLENPLRLNPVPDYMEGVEAYTCNGTPVDCIKLAKHAVLKGRKIDLCLSGINHGSNASSNIIYSGTMAAAMEASMEGIPSIGFSLLDHAADADFTAAKAIAENIIEKVLVQGIQGTKLLNVNIPKLPLEQIKGLKVCRQADGYWLEDFNEGIDPMGRTYYWMIGKFICEDEGRDTDIWALDNGYVSIMPVMNDLTKHKALAGLSYLEEK